jgi:purine-binding chemotaxis protein CheW
MNPTEIKKEEQTKEEKQNLFFIFYDNKETYGISPEHVNEVISNMESTPVPFTPNWVDGVVSIRGSIVPVINLVKYFGITSDAVRKRHRLISLKVGEYAFAVWSDDIIGVESILDNQIEPPMNNLPKELLSCVSSQFRLNDRLVYVIDLNKFILDSRQKVKTTGGIL